MDCETYHSQPAIANPPKTLHIAHNSEQPATVFSGIENLTYEKEELKKEKKNREKLGWTLPTKSQKHSWNSGQIIRSKKSSNMYRSKQVCANSVLKFTEVDNADSPHLPL